MTDSSTDKIRPIFDVSLSVFFPCYNEGENIERVARTAVEVLEGLVTDWEIIIVNDGSADDTGAIADRLAADNLRIRAVHHERNAGYGMALRTGFTSARKEYIFYTDGDGQFDMAELGRLLELRDSADIISGYRESRREGLLRRMNARCWGWLVKWLLDFRCRDVDCAFKLYKREIFDRIELRSTGALIDAEVLARAAKLGYTITDTPVTHLPRIAGTQTGAKLSVILRAFGELFKLRKDIRRSA